jgi:hypothetical protein
MALVNNVSMTLASNPGTGTLTLGEANPGYASISAQGISGTSYSYSLREGNRYEVGIGTWSSSGGTFTRDYVLTSSSVDGITAKENFSQSATLIVNPNTSDFFSNTFVYTHSAGATVEDFNPTGFTPDTNVIRLVGTGSGALTIGGIAGGRDGRILILYKRAVTGMAITIKNQSSGSTAGNRIACPGGVDLTLNPTDTVMLRYDGALAQWRVLTYVPVAATFAEASTGAAGVKYISPSIYRALSSYGTYSTSISGGSIAPNMQNPNIQFNLNQNLALGVPTNTYNGQSGVLTFVQDSTGGRTLTLDPIFKKPGGVAPVLSTAPGAIDRIRYVVRDDSANGNGMLIELDPIVKDIK